MDSAVIPTRVPNVSLVQTTDYFYPLVEDPYIQGQIACANVLSDLYAMGVADCDNMLMLLAVCMDMTTQERQVVTRLLIQGFHDHAKTAGCNVTGGQTVQNPWVIIGGVATTVCAQSDILMPIHAVAGDVLVLTKPLGNQVAVNAHQWLRAHASKPEKWDRIAHVVTPDEVVAAFEAAQRNMIRLNRNGARLMHECHAHAATDITGFGILGHAENLASNQTAAVSFVIHTLPVLRNMTKVNAIVNLRLLMGLSAETSGGLLVALSRPDAERFIARIQELDNSPAWIIGDVVEGDRTASLVPNLQILEI